MQGKHEKLAVVLSCDEGAHKDQYKSSSECIETYVLQLMLVTLLVHPPPPYRLPQLSAMGSSYVAPPPGTSAAQPVDPVPKDSPTAGIPFRARQCEQRCDGCKR